MTADIPRFTNPIDDPEFYCHGQTCIDGGCSPLHCADQPDENELWADDA